MSKHTAFLIGIFGLTIIAFISGCQFMQRLLWNYNIEFPQVTLNRIEIKKNDQNPGWWFYAADNDPTKGSEGDHGGPLAIAFVFNIQNPNKVPVLLDEIDFDVKIESYTMDSITSKEKTWIPRETTNQLRVYALLTVQSVRLNLLVQAGEKTKDKCEQNADEKDQEKEKAKENDEDKEEMNWLWCILERYWKEIPESKLPVSVVNVKTKLKAKGELVGGRFEGENTKTIVTIE
jgi:hypothetical protein